ncbi:hypothetical protein ADIARSV_3775 [Arcticibacter svalbardensis MN12-7]|uniref:Liver stage antigen n=1 Tax=Arcticibacter svalbardensis MN12-7 TaxID=1150600 RepID=R9GNF2_9SPHI|nr:hypothetical protein [Arcticibacter svalbardensis]EOR93060.1 hypothetical protein ADIARSV_3775 [Arcticibacter svalbardensis MN12-7]
MGNSAEKFSDLISKIDEFIRKYYFNKIVRGSIYLAATCFAGYLIITLSEYYGNFSPGIRAVLLFSFLLLNSLIFFRFIFWPLLSYFKLGKRINYLQASEIIGKHFPTVKDKLINTLQLKELSTQSEDGRQLIEHAINQKITELRPIPFHTAIRIQDNKKYLRYVLPFIFLIVIIAFTAPYIFSESTERILHYKTRFVKKAPFQFVLMNSNLHAFQGEDLTLQVKLTGNEIPDEIYVEEGLNTYKLQKDNLVHFKHVFRNLQKDKTIRLFAGEFYSTPYVLKVIQKPSLINMSVKITYPSYLGLRNEIRRDLTDLTVPEGTNIKYGINTRYATKIDLYNGLNQLVLKPVSSNHFEYALKARKSIELRLAPQGTTLVNGTDFLSFRLNVIPDERPTVQIIEKEDGPNNKATSFIGQLADDHGFSGLKIHYQVKDQGKMLSASSRNIPVDKKTTHYSFIYAVKSSDFKLKPGQELEFYIEVFDNDAVNGVKSSRSETMQIKRLTVSQVEKNVDQSTRVTEQKLQQAIKEASLIESETKRIKKELMNQNNLSFEQKKQVTDLLDKQRELEKLIDEIKKESDKNYQEQNSELLNQAALTDQQKQLQKLLEQVMDEKTQALLLSIEKMLQENNKVQTQEELGKMQSGNKGVQKELDRILELYKQLQFDQKLTGTINNLKKAADNQNELNKSVEEKSATHQDAADQQEKQAKEFQDIAKQLESLKKKNEELEKSHPLADLSKEEKEVNEEQKKSKNSLQANHTDPAQKSMQKAADKMSAMAKQMEEMKETSQTSEIKINLQALREILANLLKSSFDQESILIATRKSVATDPLLVSNTQKQLQIRNNMQVIGDSLSVLSRQIPQIESVVTQELNTITERINYSLESLAERRLSEAVSGQQSAMASINNLALLLTEVEEHLQKAMKNSSSGGKGNQQSLSQLGQQQDQLNKNMEKAREKMKQNGAESSRNKGQANSSQQFAGMAREQNLIRQALQQINREMNKDGRGKLGNLDKLSQDMEQTEMELVNKRIQSETLIRQHDILTHLLEADKAERERDLDDKRESKAGTDQLPGYVEKLKQLKIIKMKETELLKTVPADLNLFYQLKINEYFRSLDSI